jgi:N-carbamoyl-L-amino-acid hydrolase
VLGVLAALEVARALQANAISLRHGLALVNWTNEEGARFAPAMIASGVYARAFSCADAHASVDRDGVSLGEALRRIGYAGDVPPGAPQLSAYLELHIEQGPVLEDEHFDLGIVTGVQGMRWFDVSVAGVSCHAGTTPMATRRDPVRVAAAAVRALLELADTDPGRALVTIGVIETPLGARNTVPGKVRFTVDVRHPETAGLEKLEASLRDILANLAAATACGVEIVSVWASPPVRFDAVLIGCVEQAVEALGLRGRRIVSGAGHDAVYTARVVPTAMIFTPCRGGISHHPTESITQDEAGNGADALLQAVLEADLALA